MKKLLILLILLFALPAYAQQCSEESPELARLSPAMMGSVPVVAGCSGTGDLGNVDDGGTGGTSNGFINEHTAAGDICVDSGHGYFQRSGAGECIKMAIFNDNAGAPGSVVACSDQVCPGATGTALRDFTFSTPYQIVSGTKYYIAFFDNSPDADVSAYRYAAGSNNRWAITRTDFDTCNVSAGSQTTDRNISMWVSDD